MRYGEPVDLDKYTKCTITCKCGHRISTSTFKKGTKHFCNWCGKEIVDPKSEFKNKLQETINKMNKKEV